MERKLERRGLGRGLTALMADINLGPVPSREGVQMQTEFLLPVDKILPNPDQPRRVFDSKALSELADSIRQKGVIQPLIVRYIAETQMYEIVAGERRWRAAQIAQLHQLPVVVREMTDSEVLEVAIIENIQRADLNAIEEALAYRQLMDRFGHTQEKLAEALSKSRSQIANLLRLLTLPEDVQSMVSAGTLSAGHARALVTLPNAKDLALKIVGRGLSVRETEALVRRSSVPAAKRAGLRQKFEKDADTLALESDLAASMGMGVNISHEAGGEKGSITVTYSNLDQLDALCRALSVLRRDAG